MSRRPGAAPRVERVSLRLYVAGRLLNSMRARENLRQLCDRHLISLDDLEVVDVLSEPRRAVADDVLVTPTLIRLVPAPQVRLIGDLGDPATVLAALGVEAASS
jgi:circadian clock protein KaiB